MCSLCGNISPWVGSNFMKVRNWLLIEFNVKSAQDPWGQAKL